MFVQSEKFVEAHSGRIGDLSIYGQESNPTTWKLCKMNLAIRGINENLGTQNADSFHLDLHKDLKADFILANPPFNMSDWGGNSLREDGRWQYGTPPVGNANYAWVEHIIHHLSPSGIAGFVLANGKFRNRSGETLFIDARKLGVLIDRVHRELTEEEIARIARTYQAWRGEKDAGEYVDVPGFCKSAKWEEIKAHGYVLTPGRYVGAEEIEDDDEPFEEKMLLLTAKLEEQFALSAKLEAEIRDNLNGLGYGL